MNEKIDNLFYNNDNNDNNNISQIIIKGYKLYNEDYIEIDYFKNKNIIEYINSTNNYNLFIKNTLLKLLIVYKDKEKNKIIWLKNCKKINIELFWKTLKIDFSKIDIAMLTQYLNECFIDDIDIYDNINSLKSLINEKKSSNTMYS